MNNGLVLEVKPNGVKAWRYRFELNGKESMFAVGEYATAPAGETPEEAEARRAGRRFTLAEAREERTRARISALISPASSASPTPTIATRITPTGPKPRKLRTIEVTIAEEGEPAPVQLKFAPDAAIAGTVRARGGALPANLTVVARALDDLGGRAVRVGEDGGYVLPGLQQAPYRVVVQRAAGIVEAARAGELVDAVEVDLRAGTRRRSTSRSRR